MNAILFTLTLLLVLQRYAWAHFHEGRKKGY